MTGVNKTIVVIDDSKTFVMYAGMLLKRLGFEVIPANNANDGIQLIRVFHPHAVLLDRYMPDMEGTAVLKCLKEDPDLAGIPVIMVSASDKPEIRNECFELGCAGYLSKPLTPFTLQETLLVNLPQKDEQRRRHLRYTYPRKIALKTGKEHTELYAVSLSEGGVYLRDSKPLPVGTRVEVSLSLENGQDLQLPGQVIYQKDVYQNAFRIEPGMAIAFDADQDAGSLLRHYVSGLLAADLVDAQEEPVIRLD